MKQSDIFDKENSKKHVRSQARVVADALGVESGVKILTDYFGRDFPDELQTEIDSLRSDFAKRED